MKNKNEIFLPVRFVYNGRSPEILASPYSVKIELKKAFFVHDLQSSSHHITMKIS